ncbi:MAG: DUF4124 domain-containing protein [Candidatus Competibacteraceae bacterium]
MNPKRLMPLAIASIFLLLLSGITEGQQVYKWTDASGQVHYSQKKPEDTNQVQALDIAPTSPPAAQSGADSAAEIARINTLSDQLARERQATEQARQEQAIRDLEMEKQQLQNALLTQKLEQQQQQNNNNVITGYPPYPYPPYPPRPPYPPHPCEPWPTCYQPPHPCEPWPVCHQPPPPQPPAPPPLVKPNPPPFKPSPAGISPTPQSKFLPR